MARASSVDVRRAEAGDIDALLRLYTQLSPANGTTNRASAMRALGEIRADERMHLLVATRNSAAVLGTLTLVVVPNLTHDGAPWAQVENMVVEEAERSGGVGGVLIKAALTIAREAGCYKVQLQSGDERRLQEHDAHGFYEHLGFKPSSVGFRYYF